MVEAITVPLALPLERVRPLVQRALEEDVPWGDITSDALVPASATGIGRLVMKEDGVIAGLEVAAMVCAEVDPDLDFETFALDGDRVDRGYAVAEIRGRVRSMLTAERTALNILQRMSGIATATAAYVAAVVGTGATIVDTRKTVPGLRLLDKYAVRCGGGSNHRFSLSDGVLVKDNHLAAVAGEGLSLAATLRAVRREVPHTVKIEVEVDRIDQIEEVLQGGADIILLDNMSPEELRQAVDLIGGRALTEASGGITLETVAAVARSGVDLISVGALTHSVRALDISLEL